MHSGLSTRGDARWMGRYRYIRYILDEGRLRLEMGWSLLQNRSIFLRIPDTSVFRDRAPLSGEARKEQAMMALLRPAYWGRGG